MKTALKVLALGVAIAASATMAKADTGYSFNGGTGAINLANTTFQFTSAPNAVINIGNPAVLFSAPLNFTSVYSGAGFYNYSDTNISDQLSATAFNLTDGHGNTMSLVLTSITQSGIQGANLVIDGDGNLIINGVSQAGTFNLAENANGGTQSLSFTDNITETPEPSSLALLGTGLLGMAGVARRRFMAR